MPRIHEKTRRVCRQQTDGGSQSAHGAGAAKRYLDAYVERDLLHAVVRRAACRIAALFLQQHPKSPRTKAELSRVAQTIGNLAYQLVLEGKFPSALEASELATALMPDVVWMQTNRAHALMFADRIEEARAIYFRYRGQKSQADKLWED